MARPLAMGLALAFAGARARPILEALYGIEAEIERATRPGIEHGVAHAKLAWWRDETERLAGFGPVHPLTRALLAAAGRAPRYALLHERVTAAELHLAGFAPASETELAALLARCSASRFDLTNWVRSAKTLR